MVPGTVSALETPLVCPGHPIRVPQFWLPQIWPPFLASGPEVLMGPTPHPVPGLVTYANSGC